jgi:excisionase family DNA binding protein
VALYHGMQEELLTPEESAAFLKLHVDSVRRLLRSSSLPGVKVGGGWRIPKSALTAMLTGKKPPASVPEIDMATGGARAKRRVKRRA